MSFKHIENWIFDLDATLYPPSSNYVEETYGATNDYIKAKNNLTHAEFKELGKLYTQKYDGDWLEGFVTELKFDMEEWAEAILNADHTQVPVCDVTEALLSTLPGRKFVLTNGPRKHAERLLHHLNLFGHFEEVNTICQRDGVIKRKDGVFEGFVEKHGLDARATCMVEDHLPNLLPPHELGMTTVLVYSQSTKPFVHHSFEDLVQFLEKAHG